MTDKNFKPEISTQNLIRDVSNYIQSMTYIHGDTFTLFHRKF